MIVNVPYSRQIKYQTAFDILKRAGFYIGGRPCSPSMHFHRFDEGEYNYVGNDGVTDSLQALSPGSLHHVFDFKWKSSNGNMASLAQIWTREHVKFRTSQRASPFNQNNPPDMEFYWGESLGATTGMGRDDHSTKPPALICRFPLQAGACIAEQWYQFSYDKVTWHNIPGAAYLLNKGVRQSKGGWVFYFKKESWSPHNPKCYAFEAEYPITGPLAVPAKLGQKFMRNNGSASKVSNFGRLISKG